LEIITIVAVNLGNIILLPQVFEGNSDQDTVVFNSPKTSVITQFLRLHPKIWNEGIAMRTEFYGSNAGMITTCWTCM